LHGKRYRVGRDGVQALRLLADLYDSDPQPDGRTNLLPFRRRIRQLQAADARAPLSLVVAYASDSRLRVLAIWLRGRLGGIAGTSTLAAFCSHPHDQVRKEVARALKRMGAWSAVRNMAESDPNPRIRQLAAAQPVTPYDERLNNFARHIPRLDSQAVKRHLFIAPEVDIRLTCPAKSPSIIRMILERIHRLVSGHC
jgi:hypothetical protein